jgi:hypothetical protein
MPKKNRHKQKPTNNKQIIIIITSYITLATLIIAFLYMTTTSLTGNVIYTTQPDPTTGKDTYIRQDVEINYATASTLKIGTASTAGGQEFRPLLYFDTSSIPEENTIISATLSIYLTSSATTNNITLHAYQLTSNWTEAETTWNNKTSTTLWTTEGSDYNSNSKGSIEISSTTGWYNITITDLVESWIDGSEINYGILLYAPTATIGNYKDMASSDNSNPAIRPKLIINHASNTPPQINSISTDSNSTNPTIAGQDITFTLDWTDLESDNAQTFICSSSSISTTGCDNTEFCSTELASTNPTSCIYSTSASQNKNTTYYAATCDSNNCTVSDAQYFYTNSIPEITITQPNGGETLNQSQGNYTIQFTSSDSNSDLLTANLYYGPTQSSTENTIATNVNLTNHCTDPDSDTSTTNTCEYSWNTSGLYGTYYLMIQINDPTDSSSDSSDSSFDIKSIQDNEPPQILNHQIESSLHSGKATTINTTITDDNELTTKIQFNYTSTNITLTQENSTFFETTFYAPQPGTHAYKIIATDIMGNTNETEWQTFTVSMPNATIINQTAPTTALPYSTIKITTIILANSSLRNLYAYLNTPEDFTFLTYYPQNAYIGNLSEDETGTATWFLSVPIQENTYTLNITYSDPYTNTWQSDDIEISVATSNENGYTTTISGYPEVIKGNPYYVETSFLQSGIPTNPDTAKITLINPAGLTTGELDLTQENIGEYSYNYSVTSESTEGIWQTIINFTKSEISYIAQEYWKVLGSLFDVREVTVNNAQTPNLNISVTLENIGTATSDMNLQWNLTREDTGEILTSGSDEIGVNPTETIIHNIYPETSYIGQVRITFLGSYGEDHSQKAGAYKIFSTTSNSSNNGGNDDDSGSSSGGGSKTTETTKTTSLTLKEIQPIIYLTKGVEKTISLILKNSGTTTITNIIPTLQEIQIPYTFSPASTVELLPNQTLNIDLTLSPKEETSKQNTILEIKSDQTTITKTLQLITLTINEYYEKELQAIQEKLNSLKNELIEDEALDILKNLIKCENYANDAKTNIQNENFEIAQENLNKADACISRIEEKITQLNKSLIPIKYKSSLTWIITWILIIILIIAILIVILLLYKKIKLADFIKKEKPEAPQLKKDESLESKIEKIKEQLQKTN